MKPVRPIVYLSPTPGAPGGRSGRGWRADVSVRRRTHALFLRDSSRSKRENLPKTHDRRGHKETPKKAFVVEVSLEETTLFLLSNRYCLHNHDCGYRQYQPWSAYDDGSLSCHDECRRFFWWDDAEPPIEFYSWCGILYVWFPTTSS